MPDRTATLSGITGEIEKVIVGKREVISKILITMLARGHVLLDDVPGVGKTTLAVTLGKVMGLSYHRIQFTPDVLPSDITGFSVYNRQSGGFDYMPGAVCGANLLLGDEINRTSSKTQSALLEAMEEGQVTVDGITHPLSSPFIVIATQNNVGTAGTQLLPYAQLDRFLVKLTIGYPDFESQMEIIRGRQKSNPFDDVRQIIDAGELETLQLEADGVSVSDSVVEYITRLTMATREHPMAELGVSPRGAICLDRQAKARAYFLGRSFVIPEDVTAVLSDVCAHRIILSQKARLARFTANELLDEVVSQVPVPDRER